MTQPDQRKGMSGWWLAVIGLVLLATGVILFLLDSAGVIDAHTRPKLVFSSVTLGLVLLIMGVVMSIKGSRVEDDGRTRYRRRRR